MIRVIWPGSLLVPCLCSFLACGGGGGGPSDVITSLTLEVGTAEAEPGRVLLTVGDTGVATLNAETNDCVFNSVCPASVEAQLRSRPNGLIELTSQTVTTPGTALLVGVAPGTAYVAASAQNFSDSLRVDVVSSPLPIDSFQVRIQNSPFDESLGSTEDGAGSLLSVTLPHPGSIPLDIRIYRGTSTVSQIPWSIESTDPSVAPASTGCRPPTIDPQCDVVSHWGWITGLAPGTATVTVIVRNVQRSVSVMVQ